MKKIDLLFAMPGIFLLFYGWHLHTESSRSEALYDIHFKGQSALLLSKDYKVAAAQFRLGADKGYVWSQYQLARMLFEGKVVQQNYGEAIEWYRMAADQGHIDSQLALGKVYKNGTGVSKDYYEAAMWFEKAAVQGSVEAQLIIGVMYAGGEGVLKDLSKAKYWVKKSFENPYDFGALDWLGGSKDEKQMRSNLEEKIDRENKEDAKGAWDKYELWKY